MPLYPLSNVLEFKQSKKASHLAHTLDADSVISLSMLANIFQLWKQWLLACKPTPSHNVWSSAKAQCSTKYNTWTFRIINCIWHFVAKWKGCQVDYTNMECRTMAWLCIVPKTILHKIWNALQGVITTDEKKSTRFEPYLIFCLAHECKWKEQIRNHQ